MANKIKPILWSQTRDVEAEAEAEAGSGGSSPFFVEAEAPKFHRFHLGGKIGEIKETGSAILRGRMNGGSINIKKCERGGAV